ncbi:MAG: LPS export ABC transporter periplasmic protein LptC [Lentisphaeraceae bacterium]|nr:LPS export ABC transporter periplasmic protein LptC [Lentisphaeraceae bacterium]
MKLFSVLFLFMVLSANAVELASENIEIVADRSIYDRQKSIITFIENVEVDDGESKLICQLMDVYMDQENSPEKIHCFNDVVIRREGSVATSDRAIYLVEDQVVTLIGNVKIVTVEENGDKRIVRGTKVIYDLKTNVVEVINSKMNKAK